MRLPIGTPIAFTHRLGLIPRSIGKIKGYNSVAKDCYNISQYGNLPDWVVGITAYEDEVKIRYDMPAPFTLWQLNVLNQEDANDHWYSDEYHTFTEGMPRLAPYEIARYWAWWKMNASLI